jgi:hypothetical protein
MYETGTGAVSRYNVDRSTIIVQVYQVSCVQWSVVRVQILNRIYLTCRSTLPVRPESSGRAKSVTNNLPLLSVLCLVLLFFLYWELAQGNLLQNKPTDQVYRKAGP